MKLITKDIERQLIENGKHPDRDDVPVLKLFTPWGGATWIITDMDPEEPDRLFGLCDLGHGCPELGYVSLEEIETLRGPGGLRVERDLYFRPRFPLSVFYEAARSAAAFTENNDALRAAVPRPKRAS